MSGIEKKEINLEESEQVAGGAASGQPGMPCSKCGGFIPVTMEQITTQNSIVCPHCGFTLTVNQQESRPAIDALKKFMKPGS